MKKALSTAIITTILVASSAWASDSSTNLKIKSPREVRQENREKRKEIKEEIKDFRKEHRDELKEAKSECRTRLETATSDTEKEAIKAECKKEAKEQREALRENIKALRAEKYATLLSNFKSRLESNLSNLQALPDDKKTAFKEKMNEKLDDLEDKANEKGNDNLVLTISAIREIINSI